MQAIAAAIGGRRDGPLLLNHAARRMTTYNVQYLVAALARDARINKHVTPHGLNHSAITIGLAAGQSLRDMQDFARHATPRSPAATTAPATRSTATPSTPSPTTSPAEPERRLGRRAWATMFEACPSYQAG
jgi:integrase